MSVLTSLTQAAWSVAPTTSAENPVPAAIEGSGASIADAKLWAISIGAIVLLVTLDFIVTRKPHEVKMKEAVRWTVFYIALPVVFGAWLWFHNGHDVGVKFYTGYLVEKSLSVDNLFVFILILASFAVPKALQQRVLLIGVVGALVLRGIFIAVGAAMIARFDWTFLVFGIVLLLTSIKVFRDAREQAEPDLDAENVGAVRLLRRFFPVTGEYHGPRWSVRLPETGKRALTPMALVITAIMFTDIVFAVDSVPAVFGITSDPYIVFATNAFALLGLRALYFVLQNVLSKLVHLGYGLAIILAFIAVKLVLHWAHGLWDWVPVVPTLLSLGVIVMVLTVVTFTSLAAARRAEAAQADAPTVE